MPIARTLYTAKNGTEPTKNLQIIGPQLRVLVAPITDSTEGEQQGKLVSALIDTGASLCCIDQNLAKELGFRIFNWRPLHGVAGEELHPVYFATLTIPSLNMTYRGQLTGVKLHPNHPILLGRDILEKVIMIYDGPSGQIILSN